MVVPDGVVCAPSRALRTRNEGESGRIKTQDHSPAAWAQSSSAETMGLGCPLIKVGGRPPIGGGSLVQQTLACLPPLPLRSVFLGGALLFSPPSCCANCTSCCRRVPERRGKLPHLHHLLPPVPGHASGEAAEPWGGHPDAAVDLHQVLPGSRPSCPAARGSRGCRVAQNTADTRRSPPLWGPAPSSVWQNSAALPGSLFPH